MEEDLLDWELLHGSDTESIDSITSYEISGTSSDGMILSDHFSVDNNLIERSDQTTDPIQYGSEPLNRMHLDELGLNDSSCEGFVSKSETLGDGEAKVSGESQSGVEEHIEDLSKSWSNSGRNELVSGGDFGIVSDCGVESTEAVDLAAVNSGEESRSRETVTVWWKMPFVLLKYSVFKIGPVWSVSLAAAVMGLVLLERRRLYDMRKKAQRFNLKVAIDDKKVMHVMNQAARLNEMFTEVRRVPVIRPALPSPGAWPALSLR